MDKKLRLSSSLLVMGILFLLSGCAAALIGGAVVGAGSGTYVYLNGELKTDYNAGYDRVWAAVEKTVADMRGTDVIPAKGIGKGHVEAIINGEKVRIAVTFKEKAITEVGVRVGLIGDETASRLIHTKIGGNLKTK
ncbi:MAG TPA: DUF3568 family protein [Syntrophales bacterium]|jgi:hypothetical protein|nr:DUF3568 family protein [Syntrophales bacterium]HON22619.1 DUF3568 family protein [Syntrophales bacterium]HOU77487.1 DUF3568 family protein [Syntrophales bacterium]HPC31825.1 DUF3568 family protein [Syntrophales bacterium]HQG33484.1 DUF3568 family protein [Syntrophales bacterium]